MSPFSVPMVKQQIMYSNGQCVHKDILKADTKRCYTYVKVWENSRNVGRRNFLCKWLQRFLGRRSSEKMKDEVRCKGDFVKSSFDCLTTKHQLRQKLIKRLGGSPGLVVMGGDSHSKGCEFKPRHRILDGHNIFTMICKNCIVCLRGTENKRKRGRGWPIFFKKTAQQVNSTALQSQKYVCVINPT